MDIKSINNQIQNHVTSEYRHVNTKNTSLTQANLQEIAKELASSDQRNMLCGEDVESGKLNFNFNFQTVGCSAETDELLLNGSIDLKKLTMEELLSIREKKFKNFSF